MRNSPFKLGLYFLSLLLLPTVLIGWQLPGSGLLRNELQNAGHALAFASISFCLAHLLSAVPSNAIIKNKVGLAEEGMLLPKSWYLHSVKVLLLSVLIGGIVEVLQSKIGREMSVKDILFDGLGACSGLCVYFASLRLSNPFFLISIPLRARVILLLTAAIIQIVSFSGVFSALANLETREKTFPVLFDGEYLWVNRFLRSQYGASLVFELAPSLWRENNTRVAKLLVRAGGRWPSLLLPETVLSWKGYSVLQFEIFSEQSEELMVTLRIHDALHNHRFEDRFNRSFVVKPGANQYAVSLNDIAQEPKGRVLDLDRVANVAWFMSKPSEDYVLYFDNIRLK